MGYGDIEFPERLGREHEKRDTRFHVEHARPPQPPRGLLEGHTLDRTDRPDRVEMAQPQHLRSLSAPGKVEFDPQMIAVAALATQLDLGERGHVVSHVFDRPVDGGLIVGRGFNAHQTADPID